MTIGPVQLLVIGFDHDDFHGQIKAELDRLNDSDIVRLVDLLFIRRHDDGRIERTHVSQLDEGEREELGAVVGALIGLGVGGLETAEKGAELGVAQVAAGGSILPDEVRYIDDALPPGSAAAVALIEHRWAIDLRERIRDAGGVNLADAWVHPLDLVAIGLMAAEEADQSATS